MKVLIGLFLTLSLAACIPQAKTNSPSSTKTAQGSGPSAQSNPFIIIDAGTGSGSNLGEEIGTGSGTYTVVPPTPTPVPTPSLTEYCGKLYISKTGIVMFINEDEQYRIINPHSNAQQVVNNISFPNDAFNACVHGTLTKQWLFTIINAEYIQLSDGIVNPERAENKESYTYELCGTIMYKTDQGQAESWMQIKVGSSYKIVKEPPQELKDYLDENGNTDGCLYNNEGTTHNFKVTFKEYFKPTEFNLGW